MKKTSLGIVAVGVLSLVILGGCNIQNTNTPIDVSTDEQASNIGTSTIGENEMPKGYLAYNQDALKEAFQEDKQVILFFHASRCPSCRKLDKALNKEIDAIPNDVAILKVNYDKESDLKKMYNITTQHTLVLINSDLSEQNKLIGGDNLDDVLTLLR